MFGTIPNFPCNSGVVCFGEPGVTRGKCSPGACTTISWNTSPGNAGCTLADQSPPGGQCRHQQVCIVGFGASLECTAGCDVACGGGAGVCHTIRADASCSDGGQTPCTGTATVTVKQCVGTTKDCTP